MEKIQALILASRAARDAYNAQDALVYADGKFNGRYSKKARRLHAVWKNAEKELLKAVYSAKL